MYLPLAILFFLSVLLFLINLIFLISPLKWIAKIPPLFLRRLRSISIIWFMAYSCFILFFTGPKDINLYPSSVTSPYKLPWKAGVKHFVSQGNFSFTSHRGLHEYAWDFWMPIGTEIIASREGRILAIEQSFSGIGLQSNFIKIQHSDGTIALYAHIKKNGAIVQIGSIVTQGQPIAYSGMVGQTINPHLHFVVLNKDENLSIPISFNDLPEGVPLAGQFYESKNGGIESIK